MNTRYMVSIAVAGLLLSCSSARAVTQMDDVHFFGYTNEIPPSGSLLAAGFTARATATDIASGVTFSLQERDPDGNDVLFEVTLEWVPPYPAIGTELRVGADFRLRCDQGKLVPMYVNQWFVSWCDPNLGSQVRSAYSSESQRPGTSEPEDFEFILVDEAGNEAPGGTAEDAFHCGAGIVSISEATSGFVSPFELVSQGQSIASQAGLFPRSDPSTEAESGGTIQIAFDPLGEHACGEIPPGTPVTMYVVARRSGPAVCGVTGAEFRIRDMPAEWYATATLPPGCIGIGDPFGAIGANMAYHSCQRPSEGPVLLYTISVFATTVVTDHVIRVTARTPPGNPRFDCPLVTLCDVPIFSIVCMSGSEARINPPADTSCSNVSVGIEPRSWGGVKELYR